MEVKCFLFNQSFSTVNLQINIIFSVNFKVSVAVWGINRTECFVILLYNTQNVNRKKLSLAFCCWAQAKRLLLFFFSVGERKQTLFPEDRVQRNSLPNFFINSGCKLSSVCTEDARHHADTLYLFICSVIMEREIIESPEFTIWKRLSLLDWWIHVCGSLPGPPAFPVKCCTVMRLLGNHCCKIHRELQAVL